MDSKSDRDYLIAVKTEYKLLEKKYLNIRAKLEKWEKRATLAEEKRKFKLQSEAEAQAESVRNEIKYLTDQLLVLKVEVEKAVKINSELPQQQLSIDPKNLLAEMNTLIGDGQSLEIEKKLNIIQVDNELEELKKRMES